MNPFHYANGAFCAEDVALGDIADAIGTPFYCYSTAALIRHYRVCADVLPKGTLVAYSVKANGNLAILRTLKDAGAGADIVSLGELKRALAAGIPPERIVFSGVGKTKDEMRAALSAGIHQFNVESEPELEALNIVAGEMHTRAPVAIRVNPDVDAGTHAKITTGTAETKFGVPWTRVIEVFAHAARLPHIRVVGIDLHLGSQIREIAPFESAFRRIMDLVVQLRALGHRITRADFGGGLGVPDWFAPDVHLTPQAYGAMVMRLTRDFDLELIIEPGRLVVANAGVLVSRVIYVKKGEAKTFLIIDAGMNDLVRPAMYGAHHDVVPVNEAAPDAPRTAYDVVGPICETADTFARDYEIPTVQSGDLVAIMTAGAYGSVMASSYNARPPAADVLVKGSEWSVVRPPITHEAQMALEPMPRWLNAVVAPP